MDQPSPSMCDDQGLVNVFNKLQQDVREIDTNLGRDIVDIKIGKQPLSPNLSPTGATSVTAPIPIDILDMFSLNSNKGHEE